MARILVQEWVLKTPYTVKITYLYINGFIEITGTVKHLYRDGPIQPPYLFKSANIFRDSLIQIPYQNHIS